MERHLHVHRWPPHPFQVRKTHAEVTADGLRGLAAWPGFGPVIVILGALIVLGIIGMAGRFAAGNPKAMGYYVAIFVFLMSTVQAVPMIAFMSRLAKGHWARPVRRVMDLFGVAGIVTFLWFLPIPAMLPPMERRNTIWFNWPVGAPGFWDTLAVFLTAALGLAILYVAARPDLAIVGQEAPPGLRRSLAAWLAGNWRGTQKQWRNMHPGLVTLGAFYAMMFVFTHYLIASDLSMSLVPGWVSSIYPPYHVISSFAGGVATIQLAMMLLRVLGGRRDYVAVDPHWGLAKLQLALALLWFYHNWADFLTIWYGRSPRELALLQQLYFGPYALAYAIAFFGCFVIPLLSLIWNKVRISYWGPIWVASWVLIGLFFDRIRLYVGSWSVYAMRREPLDLAEIPPTTWPALNDLLILLGGLAAPVFLYLLAARLIPNISLWEIKEGLLLQRIIDYLRTEARVIAKPR